MITIQLASEQHVKEICTVCTEAYWATYKGLLPDNYIERKTNEFYNVKRVQKEVNEQSRYWGGYVVALEEGKVLGAGGGGMTGDKVGELFVLYLDSSRRNEGIGSKILQVVTNQQRKLGANEQWASVQKGNQKGIPFYEAKGFLFQQEQPSFESKLGDEAVSLRYMRKI